MQVQVPVAVQSKLDELLEICEKYPMKIPLPVCATFLGIHGQSLRACIEGGHCPFGLGWLKENAGNRAFYIPTATFYIWYTQGSGFRAG